MEENEKLNQEEDAPVETVEKSAGGSGKRARKAAAVAGGKARELAGSAAERMRELSETPEFKSIGGLTWTALGLGFLFLLFMPFDALNLRWWVMLPLGVGGAAILWHQWASARGERGFEAKVCFAALAALLALMLLRDALLSNAMLEIYDTTSALDSTLDEVNRALGK